MNSELAARREARRQRILNNSENRLRRIVDGKTEPQIGLNVYFVKAHIDDFWQF